VLKIKGNERDVRSSVPCRGKKGEMSGRKGVVYGGRKVLRCMKEVKKRKGSPEWKGREKNNYED